MQQRNATDPAKHASELLLNSMYYARAPERRRHSFLYSRPGKGFGMGGMGIEINYDNDAFLQAELYVRRFAAPHLRSLSVSDVGNILTNFVCESFWTISREAWGGRSENAFGSFLSESAKHAFSEAMRQSNLFVEPRMLTLFPLVVILSEEIFDFTDFFVVPPSGVTAARLATGARDEELAPGSFPPFQTWDGKRHTPASWLGVWGPNIDVAKRDRAAILGAIALLPHRMERYLFTGRQVFGGRCTLKGNRYETSFGDSHTPPLSENIVLTAGDRPWLITLAQKLRSHTKADRRQVRALEYYYRAWAPDPVKRFPTLFATLDAIFGDAGAATQAVVDAVGPIMGPEYGFDRLRLLLSLRASVVHGGAPNVYESSSYHRYYERYKEDATRDLELIVARCLQSVIFDGSLVERPHTYAALIKEHTGMSV